MKKTLFLGSATALVTPFKNDKVDFDALSKIVEHQLNNATSALVVCGTTGEPSTMTTGEQEDVVKFVVEQVAKEVPVIAGTGGNNTQEVIRKAKRYAELGVDAQLCVTPYYNKTTQKGLVAHYTAIAENSELPVILYNVPGRTGLNMLPQTVKELSLHPNIIGLKEAHADLVQASEVARLVSEDFAIYSGIDELIVPMLSLGSKGVFSVVSNLFPKHVADLISYYFDGMHKESLQMQLKLLPFVQAIFKQTSPTPIKAAMAMLDLCHDEVRLPLVPLNDEEKASLRKVMEQLL